MVSLQLPMRSIMEPAVFEASILKDDLQKKVVEDNPRLQKNHDDDPQQSDPDETEDDEVKLNCIRARTFHASDFSSDNDDDDGLDYDDDASLDKEVR